MTSSDYNENIQEVEDEVDKAEHGATVPVQIVDGRLNSVAQASLVEVYPVPSDRSMYYVRLRTDHYSFSIRSSCVTRSPAMFYQFRSILRSHHPDLAIPRLPLQPALWVSSYQSVSLQLASFLAQLLTIKELLSSKALHLFLQSQLSMQTIKANMEGRRDDEVVVPISDLVKDERNNTKEGFGGLFGAET